MELQKSFYTVNVWRTERCKIQSLQQFLCSNSTFCDKNSLFVTLKYAVYATTESSVSATL